MSLLKAYSTDRDVEKTVEVLRLILRHKMVLPTTFVRDVCWRAGVPENVRYLCVCVCTWWEGIQNSSGKCFITQVYLFTCVQE